jgi:hypothetical protein
MSRVSRHAFRPEARLLEGRELTTAGVGSLAAAHAAQVHAHHAAVVAAREAHRIQVQAHHAAVAPAAAHGHAHKPTLPPSGRPGIGPGLGRGLVRLALPGSFGDFGVVSIWNNTLSTANFSVSASTFNNGLYYPFSLAPGQVRSFYASVAPVTGTLPVFQVSFGLGTPSIALPQDNLIFETKSWVPNGTAGYPYAINFGVNGYYLSYI